MDTAPTTSESADHQTQPSSSFSTACFTTFTSDQLAKSVSKTIPQAAVPHSPTTNEYKECANCGVNDTPLWRKYNDHDLCNACGIYFRVNGFHRPFLPNMRKLLSSARKMGLSCVNCSTKVTSMWRRTPEGESICNACGLYFRLNGVKRPVSMRKDWIRKRQRKTQQISGIMRLANQAVISSASLGADQQLQFGLSPNSAPSVQLSQQQEAPSIPLQPTPSFDANQLGNMVNQSHCFPLNAISTGAGQQSHDEYMHYYDFNQSTQMSTYQSMQSSTTSNHHELQPMMSSNSYMHQQPMVNHGHEYGQVVECTNGYSSQQPEYNHHCHSHHQL